MINIGKEIKQIRVNKNMTQEKLHNASGVAKATIVSVERGNHVANFDTAQYLLEAMGYELIIVKKVSK